MVFNLIMNQMSEGFKKAGKELGVDKLIQEREEKPVQKSNLEKAVRRNIDLPWQFFSFQ